MEKVKKLIEAGARVPVAIKEALAPVTIDQMADKYSVPRTALSTAINSNVKPSDEVINALVSELGGDSLEWRRLLWKAGEPVAA